MNLSLYNLMPNANCPMPVPKKTNPILQKLSPCEGPVPRRGEGVYNSCQFMCITGSFWKHLASFCTTLASYRTTLASFGHTFGTQKHHKYAFSTPKKRFHTFLCKIFAVNLSFQTGNSRRRNRHKPYTKNLIALVFGAMSPFVLLYLFQLGLELG